jgi:FAD/FMN-containing dehydrogenase
MHPTMAGCVGMNIHGKNCFKVGPFGDSVLEVDLMTASGERKTLSREREPELFRAVIAGLGLFGAVTRVKLKLKHVESGRMRVRPIVTDTLGRMFDEFEQHMSAADYAVGWVDCFANGRDLGRGLVHVARHLHGHDDHDAKRSLAIEEQELPASIMGMPKSMLWMFMKPFWNDVGVRLINQAKYVLPEPVEEDGSYLQSHAGFAFLLDYVPDWRLAYGIDGFIQVQLFVPEANAREAFAEALRLCQRRGIVSYLGVFKRHRPDEYLLSHGLDGWSLALDFKVPRDSQRLWDTAADLTRLVRDAGGTYYPAKDQVVDAGSFARVFGDRVERFRALQRRMDPDGLFANDQAKRLGLV